MNEDVDDFLEHFGVKGMHWGVRKTKQERLAKRSSEGKKTDQLLEKRSQYGNRSLTNKQLESLNRRLGLEQTLNNLSRPPAKTGPVKKGHSFVKEALAIGATANAVYAFSKTPAGRKVADMFKEAARPGHSPGGGFTRTKTNAYHVPVAQLALGAGTRALGR